MEIRKATPEDIGDLQEIFDLPENLDKLEKYSDKELYFAIKNPKNLFLVIASNGQVDCFIWITGLDEVELCPKIEEFASRTPGIGHGSTLLRFAFEHLREHGYRRIWLATAADNTNAIEFYSKFGFSEFEIRKKIWKRRSGDVADGLLMRASLEDLRNTQTEEIQIQA